MKLCKAFLMSMGMYSIIPVPNLWEDKLFSMVIPLFPLVGAVIGGLWLLLAFLLVTFGAPLMLAAALLCFTPMVLSGFIHIDGLMDTADAVFSRAKLEKKQAILKDSHIGAFAAISLCIWAVLSFAAVYSGLAANKNLLPLLFIPILSRSLSGFFMLTVKPIWESGYAVSFQQGVKNPHRAVLIVFGGLTLILGFITGGFSTLWVLLALLAGGGVAAAFSTHELKGISGDLCGFILTVSEFAALIIWAIV